MGTTKDSSKVKVVKVVAFGTGHIDMITVAKRYVTVETSSGYDATLTRGSLKSYDTSNFPGIADYLRS
ncbi:MAG: hypothetical protein ABSA33_01730 [Candidatus Micrarchaeaceae archaeon]